MKTRVNSRINNVKGKRVNSSLRVKVQGYKSVDRSKAIGYCMFHQINVSSKLNKIKNCTTCDRFIAFINREIQKNKKMLK